LVSIYTLETEGRSFPHGWWGEKVRQYFGQGIVKSWSQTSPWREGKGIRM
jgi:hypothetical protein